MIVIDASAALSGLLTAGQARTMMATENLMAPQLIDYEIANALRRRTFAGDVDSATAWGVLEAWQRIGIRRFAASGHLERVWELRDNVSAYDAAYVSLAEALGCPLITCDSRLARAPGVACPITVLQR